jgi:Putative transmembrane protein (PGPGW)
MSPGADDNDSHDAERPTVTLPRAGEPARRVGRSAKEHQHEHHHHILIEPEEDRWRWRRKIRENPRKLIVYRVAVGLLGLFLIALGLVSGPIPGPGGIPLVLFGLAVWSSEFEWAHQLMLGFKKELHRYRTWPRAKKGVFWVIFFACCGIIGYLYLLTLGIPRWLPGSVDVLLQRLPGL